MPALHAVLGNMKHMSCHHYMQFQSLWGTCHALAYYLYYIVLLYVTLYYFALCCNRGLIDPMDPEPLGCLRHTACHHCMQFWSSGRHRPHPCYMQFWSLWDMDNTIITCHFWACNTYAMPSFHAVLELMGHMPCHHYMQLWSTHGMLHAFITYKFWAWDTYVMPSAITLHCFVSHCTLSLIDPMGTLPWGLEEMHHALITCGSGAYACICYTLIACSSGPCEA